MPLQKPTHEPDEEIRLAIRAVRNELLEADDAWEWNMSPVQMDALAESIVLRVKPIFLKRRENREDCP